MIDDDYFKDTSELAQIAITPLSDYLLHFFAGRRVSSKRLKEQWNWFDDTAMTLGTSVYVIVRGKYALIYDTLCCTQQGQWIRDYLESQGIRRFIVVNSHWHLDHIGGNAAFSDQTIVAHKGTYQQIADNISAIEAGKLWGEPAISSVTLPNVSYEDHLTIYVGDLEVQVKHINIHSPDGTVLYLPKSRTLFCGDTLEDPISYIVHPEELPKHLTNLKTMRAWDIDRIFPNHGDPAAIRSYGYGKELIDATIEYISGILACSQDAGCLECAVERMIENALCRGWVHMWEPYKLVHAQNMKVVHEYWRDRALPARS